MNPERIEQWKKAQTKERQFHTDPFEIGYIKYFESYRQYFSWLNIDFDLKQKSILEIGPADYPAIGYSINGKNCEVIEPMPLSILKEILNSKSANYTLLNRGNNTAEFILIEANSRNHQWDEIWMFNLLQHVIDPDIIIAQAKQAAKTIRFFEPINMGTNDCHLHAFNYEYFYDRLGPKVSIYPGDPNASNFHTHECAYGIWKK